MVYNDYSDSRKKLIVHMNYYNFENKKKSQSKMYDKKIKVEK